MLSICCVGFASLDIVCDELHDCAWNVGVVVYPDFVVGPGFVSTSPAFVRSSASYPAGPHGQLAAQKNGKSGSHCWGREGPTQFAQQFVTATPLVGCVGWNVCSSFLISVCMFIVSKALLSGCLLRCYLICVVSSL